MRNFRPNIVFSGAEAWAEDNMKVIQIGNLKFSASKICGRCKMTTINQDEGIIDGREPLKTMETFRRQREHKDTNSSGIMFGKNLIQMNYDDSNCVISVGDKLSVLESEDRSGLTITK